MAGRRIRWANAGRAAAIAAAVLAGLATLPALLREDEPPPLPEDVGLGGMAPARAPVPPAAPLTTKPAVTAQPGRRATKRRPERGDGGRTVNQGRPGGPGRRARHGEKNRRARHGGRERDSEAAGAPPPVAVPTYVPTYAPPPAAPGRREFRIEG
jgi:hypothetical protein